MTRYPYRPPQAFTLDPGGERDGKDRDVMGASTITATYVRHGRRWRVLIRPVNAPRITRVVATEKDAIDLVRHFNRLGMAGVDLGQALTEAKTQTRRIYPPLRDVLIERCKDGEDRWVKLPPAAIGDLRAHGEGVLHVIDDVGLPTIGALPTVVWFGIISAAEMLLGIAGTEVVRRRIDPNSHRAVANALFAIDAGSSNGTKTPRPSASSSRACKYGVEMIALPALKAYARVPETTCASARYGVM